MLEMLHGKVPMHLMLRSYHTPAFPCYDSRSNLTTELTALSMAARELWMVQFGNFYHWDMNNAFTVIPDYAKMRWYVRAPTRDQLTQLTERVSACFESASIWHSYSRGYLTRVYRGAALATSCRLKITKNTPYYDLRQNSILGKSPSQMFLINQ